MARDISEHDFATAVLERSRTLPVVVDFWADWCGPCRALTPVLERVASAYAGRVELVKVDTEANQMLAAELGIRGIPAVKAFRDGALVDEFVGAQPEPQVLAFFEGLVAMDEALAQRDATVSRARELIEAGDPGAARALLAQLPADAEVSQLLADIELRESGVSLDDPEPLLRELLAAVQAGDRDGARARMVQVFEVLGQDHPLTRRYRAELSRALFA